MGVYTPIGGTLKVIRGNLENVLKNKEKGESATETPFVCVHKLLPTSGFVLFQRRNERRVA
jgi:hypothetical protein